MVTLYLANAIDGGRMNKREVYTTIGVLAGVISLFAFGVIMAQVACALVEMFSS
jgi:hypothetical protein